MKNTILFFYSLLFASCACYYEDIRQEREILNPTSYVYDFSEMEVRRVLDSCFALSRSQLSTKTSEKYRGGLKSLKILPGKEQVGDSSLRFSGIQDTLYPASSPPRSYVFRDRKGRFLWAYAEYILRICPLEPFKTKVEVLLHDSHVTVGRKLGFNPVSNGVFVPRNKPVFSTTIEEYEILKYVGNKLGQKGMPPIYYPKALTKEEILDHFRNGNYLNFPFTDEDIYGW